MKNNEGFRNKGTINTSNVHLSELPNTDVLNKNFPTTQNIDIKGRNHVKQFKNSKNLKDFLDKD